MALDHGVLDIIYKLTDTKIKVGDIGKLSQEIIDYLTDEKSLVENQIFQEIKSWKDEDERKKKENAK